MVKWGRVQRMCMVSDSSVVVCSILLVSRFARCLVTMVVCIWCLLYLVL